MLRGLSQQRAQKIDLKIVDDVRNMLFGPPGSGGLDLASLNIQRGRDHGLASYTQTRQALGLSSVTTFADITSDLTIQEALKQTYSDVGDIDLWTGGLAEPVISGALVGETISAILIVQFIRLRDGDRFWYQRYLPNELIEWVEEQTLAKIIKRNTDIDNELTNNVFIIQDNIQTSNEMCTIIKPKNGKISLVCL